MAVKLKFWLKTHFRLNALISIYLLNIIIQLKNTDIMPAAQQVKDVKFKDRHFMRIKLVSLSTAGLVYCDICF